MTGIVCAPEAHFTHSSKSAPVVPLLEQPRERSELLQVSPARSQGREAAGVELAQAGAAMAIRNPSLVAGWGWGINHSCTPFPPGFTQREVPMHGEY